MGDIKKEKRHHRSGDDGSKKYEMMRIPDYILDRESAPANFDSASPPETPIVVFVNSKSGGQLGGAIIVSFRAVLNPKQVFDLADEKPEEVLNHLLGHLEKLKEDGDQFAIHVRTHMRIIVAGGDGTAGWLLGVMGDMRLEHPPPIATMPLGTGNNLPFSFGWGKKNPGTDEKAVKKFLREVTRAGPLRVDSWHVTMKMAVDGKSDSLEPVKVPHSLHSFKRIVDSTEHEDGRITFRGGFWNYFSIGMDAEVAYAFHSERTNHPEKFKNQITNQSQYAKFTCKQGWFCVPCLHYNSRNINQLAKIKVAKHGEAWQELDISRSIRSIVVLNLPSFSGGLNPWGNPSDKKSKERGLTAPFVDDGLLEVVGFRDAWQGAVLFTPNGHGVRLAQTHRLRIEFHPKKGNDKTYMRMDGEPWLQPLPDSPKPTVLEINQLGQSLVLATRKSIAKSDSYAPPIQPGVEVGVVDDGNVGHEDQMATGPKRSSSSSSSSSDSDYAEINRKFGAASTFKRSDIK